MSDPVIADLVDVDGKLKVNAMALALGDLEDIVAHCNMMRTAGVVMKWALAVNTGSIVAKFFKAFGSNPRLTTVTNTFKSAAEDFAHFFIIFTTLYVPFCIVGHVLFGEDVEDFNSLYSSLLTGITVLFGEFGFYVDSSATLTMFEPLPSGMPIMALFTWYILYMFLVFIVLMNMLLAIIIDHYTKATYRLHHLAVDDKPPVWRQAAIYWRFKKQTKHYISFEDLRQKLDDDDEPVHPEEMGLVTEESLRDEKAFPDMTPENAEWFMKYLAREKEKLDEFKRNSSNGGEIYGNLKTATEAFSEKKGLVLAASDTYAEFVGAQGMEEFTKYLHDIQALITKFEFDNKKIQKRMDILSGGSKAKNAFRIKKGGASTTQNLN
jgi:hypothetical protein